MPSGKNIVVFIDLLGTKESHNVSNATFGSHIDEFLYVLISEAQSLDKKYFKISHFSDCAFVFCNNQTSHNDLYNYLSRLRISLLQKNLYFKSGIAFSGGKTYTKEEVREKLFSNFSEEVISHVDSFCDYTLFGPHIVPAYLGHEVFKGVGFYIKGEIEKKDNDNFVESVFVSDQSTNKFTSFYDLKFRENIATSIFDLAFDKNAKFRSIDTFLTKNLQDTIAAPHEEWRNWYNSYFSRKMRFDGILTKKIVYQETLPVKYCKQNTDYSILLDKIIKAIKKSHIKDKNYPKYYLSLLVTIIKSSAFDFIWYDSRKSKWNGFPYVFYRLIVNDLYFNFFKKFNYYYILIAVILNEVLFSIDTRRKIILTSCSDELKETVRKDDLLPQNFIENYFTVAPSISCEDFKTDDSFLLSALKTAKITEEAIIIIFLKIGFRDVSGELKKIPDSIIHGEYKNRIIHLYSTLDDY